MIRLLATDLDGTLLPPGGAVPEGNAAALREAAALGVRIVFATVRIRRTTLRTVGGLGVPFSLVCQGGATVYGEEGGLLREICIPLDLAREVAAFADARGVGLLTTRAEEFRFGPGYEPGLPGVPPPTETLRTNLEAVDGAPTRFMVSGERGVSLLMERFAGAPLRFVRHYRGDGTLIDAAVTAAGATKEAGLGVLGERYGIAPGAMLALGDAEADVGMFSMAGVGVAVANAPESVRAAADWVAPAAADCGVAAAIRRFVIDGNATAGRGDLAPTSPQPFNR